MSLSRYDQESLRFYPNPSNPFFRAAAGAVRLIGNSAPYVVPAITSAVEQYRRGRSLSAGSSAAVGHPNKGRRVMARSRSRSVNRGRRMRRMTSRSRARRGRSASAMLSTQRDQSTRYTGGRRNGRRRRARRFARRVVNSILMQQPLQIYTAKHVSTETSNLNLLGQYAVGLFTTQYGPSPDLENICTDAGISIGTSTDYGKHLYIKNACLDVEIVNAGTDDCIIDVYEMILRRDTNSAVDLTTLWQTLYAEFGTISAASYNDPANSIFQNPQFCQFFRVKSKREVLIPPSGIVTMQMRDGKDRMIQAEKVFNMYTGIPGLTRFYYLMWHGIPKVVTGVPSLAATTLTIGWQKSYAWGLPPTPQVQPRVHNS